MVTAGIDLAAQPENTAICSIDWGSRAVDVWLERDGPGPVEAMREAAWTGIDAPFGWPAPFTEAIGRFEREGTWTGEASTALRHRATDRWVHEHGGPSPLSVSSDRIAVCAWRCAAILAEHAATSDWTFRRVRADGDEAGIVEVYPAAALRRWDIEHKGYKREALVRERIVDDLGIVGLELDASRAALVADHNQLDALLCALIARAVAVGLTEPPEDDDVIAREGWIELPLPGSLAELG